MRIKAELLAKLWLEIVKAARYIRNRTLIRKLGWKTLFKAVKKEKLRYAYIRVYKYRAYPLNHHILRKDKLDPQAHIRYLVGYNLTNIYQI